MSSWRAIEAEVATGLPKAGREAGAARLSPAKVGVTGAAQAGPETGETVVMAGAPRDDLAVGGAATGAPLSTEAGGPTLEIPSTKGVGRPELGDPHSK